MRILALLGVLGVLSCSGPVDNRYVHLRPAVEEKEQTHPIKELHGKNKVDIVWVIDNSGSMSENQNQVKTNAALFIDNFIQQSNLQWQIGLISTDVRGEPYVGFKQNNQLNWQTPDPVSKFQNAVGRLGTSGDTTERLYEPLLRMFGQYPNFVRRDAVLAIVGVSDEEEQSRQSTQEFVKDMVALKGDINDVYSYGLFASSDDGCDSSFTFAGSKYEEFIDAFVGKSHSLCDANVGAKLAIMGKDLVDQLISPRFYLNNRPVVDSIVVFHKGNELPAGPKSQGGYWTYDYGTNAIVFHDLEFAPDENEEVTVQYDTEIE